MILTFPQFQNLWQQHFAAFLPNINPHNLYQSYLIRENCLEDFLDIFRGYDTRAQRQKNILLPHRFQHLFNANYNINYILVAEAAPFGESYIYLNGRGSYITAPLNTFNVINVSRLNATDRIVQLAANGVVILDLFPFNLQFNFNQGFLRNQLINNNTTLNYLTDFNNVYSVINRVNELINTIQNCNLQNGINTAFMATPLINNYLSANFPNIPGNPLLIQNGLNNIVGNQIQNNAGSFYNLGNLTTVPQYCSEGCAASGSPHATLIKNALNL